MKRLEEALSVILVRLRRRALWPSLLALCGIFGFFASGVNRPFGFLRSSGMACAAEADPELFSLLMEGCVSQKLRPNQKPVKAGPANRTQPEVFDSKKYQAEKQKFLEELQASEGKGLDLAKRELGELQKAALLDAFRDYHGHDLVGLGKILESGTPAQKQEVSTLLKRFDPTRASLSEFRDLSAKLFDLTYPRFEKLPGWLRPALESLPKSPGSILSRRLAIALVESDLNSALVKTGAIDPKNQGFLQRIGKWRAKNAAWEGAIALGAIDALTLRLPDLRITDWRQVPPEVLKTVREKGFDSAYTLLRDKYGFGKSAKFDSAWKSARLTYQASITVYTTMLLVSCLKDHWGNKAMDDPTAMSSGLGDEKKPAGPFNRRLYLEAQMESLIATYDGGKWPDPRSPEIRAELEQFAHLADELDRKAGVSNAAPDRRIPDAELRQLQLQFAEALKKVRARA